MEATYTSSNICLKIRRKSCLRWWYVPNDEKDFSISWSELCNQYQGDISFCQCIPRFNIYLKVAVTFSIFYEIFVLMLVTYQDFPHSFGVIVTLALLFPCLLSPLSPSLLVFDHLGFILAWMFRTIGVSHLLLTPVMLATRVALGPLPFKTLTI